MKHTIKKHINTLLTALLVAFCASILMLSIRGLPGNPTAQMLNQAHWRDNGPLELSPERGRYAIIYSLVEDKSLQFSVDLAKFIIPDVGYINNQYTSIFAPAVSFVSLPGYYVGRYFGHAQIGAFAVIAVFAVLNFLLIRAIAIHIGAHPVAAALAGLTFLFATPAFAYAVTLYQHHISTFLILTSIFLLLKSSSFFSLFFVWMIIAFSITVDNPNFFLMIPTGLFAVYRTFSLEKLHNTIHIKLPFLKIFSLIGVILPVIFFLWFNYAAYGNPLQLPGTIQRTPEIGANGKPILIEEDTLKTATKPAGNDTTNDLALAFFKNRNITNGMISFFISLDRGMLIYTPVILLGFIGFIVAAKRKHPYATLLFAFPTINLIIYAMWGDPYGGWAFGSRYLIPGYAILSIFIALLLSYWNKKILFILIFFITLSYSVGVNTLGALTSNRNPPQTEAIALQNRYKIYQPYTYERNTYYLNNNNPKSYVYNTYTKPFMNAWTYYAIIVSMIVGVAIILIIKLWKINNVHVHHYAHNERSTI